MFANTMKTAVLLAGLGGLIVAVAGIIQQAVRVSRHVDRVDRPGDDDGGQNYAVSRHGGDEFLVVGAPTRSGLAAALDAFRRAWPARFAARFGEGTPVVSRILTTSGQSKDLRAMRERLGRALTPLKRAAPPGPDGLLVTL